MTKTKDLGASILCKAEYTGCDLQLTPFNPQSAQVRIKYFPDPFIPEFLDPLRLIRGLNELSSWVSGLVC